ncbi:hypothetical protein E2562_015474 [Oryza meyeriana var. granulata]|uniref:Uncharacterized protein n=1 Tax=Oryza meyeriana var. granulata TaxID=110450 RepID=A0A6G1BX30_9ORYZ|nr:hypothetical protein E2562_015474 [Oryza meyeriana var. granulata]
MCLLKPVLGRPIPRLSRRDRACRATPRHCRAVRHAVLLLQPCAAPALPPVRRTASRPTRHDAKPSSPPRSPRPRTPSARHRAAWPLKLTAWWGAGAEPWPSWSREETTVPALAAMASPASIASDYDPKTDLARKAKSKDLG